MGFFDMKCMLTGVSVDLVGTLLVVLRCTPAGYEPISLGVPGEYDGTGSIFPESDDRGVELLHGYLSEQHRNGRFVVKPAVDDDPIDFPGQYGVQGLLTYLMDSWLLAWPYGDNEPLTPLPLAVLDGDALVYALIAQPVWDAIAAASSAPAATLDAAFGNSTIPREIYGAHVLELDSQLRALAQMTEFVRTKGLRWAPPAEPDQRYPSDGDQWGEAESMELVAQARVDYRDDPAVLAGLDAYVERLKAEGYG